MEYDEQALRELLFKHFGWDRFRSSTQLEAIQAVLSRRNVFVRSGTGSGKSLIWQLAALARVHIAGEKKLTVVVYPTKALLLDQESKLRGIALKVVCLHGDQTTKAKSETLNRIELMSRNMPDILLTVPEFMVSMNTSYTPYLLPPLLNRLQLKDRLSLIVIDEAQQVLQWGESFRRAYLNFADILSHFFSNTPRLALSAAITETNIDRTVQRLGMEDYVLLSETLDQPTIYHEVRMKESKNLNVYRDLKNLLQKGQGIIYCATRKQTSELAHELVQAGIRAEFYHGGLEGTLRSTAVAKWTSGETDVLVATVSFMFGIDYKKVRWVVWDTFPSSVENWVQGSGRAGRDGEKAWSIVYYRPTDQDVIKNLKSQDNSYEVESLNRVTDILHDSVACRRYNILSYFGETPKDRCDNCDNCFSHKLVRRSLIEHDVTEDAQNIIRLLQSMAKWSTRRGKWIETRNGLISAILGKKTRNLTRLPPNWDGNLFGCQIVMPYGRMMGQELTILISELVKGGILEERHMVASARYGRTYPYLRLGPKAEDLLNGTVRIRIHMPVHAEMGAEIKSKSRSTRSQNAGRQIKKRVPQTKFKAIREVINGREVECIVLD